MTPTRGLILDEARALICGDRNATYGDPVDSFTRAAAIFTARTGIPLTARQAVILMECVKQARRDANPLHRDSYTDDAGYIGIEYECALAESK